MLLLSRHCSQVSWSREKAWLIECQKDECFNGIKTNFSFQLLYWNTMTQRTEGSLYVFAIKWNKITFIYLWMPLERFLVLNCDIDVYRFISSSRERWATPLKTFKFFAATSPVSSTKLSSEMITNPSTLSDTYDFMSLSQRGSEVISNLRNTFPVTKFSREAVPFWYRALPRRWKSLWQCVP